MYGKFQKHLQDELKAIEEAGLYKKERNIESLSRAPCNNNNLPYARSLWTP